MPKDMDGGCVLRGGLARNCVDGGDRGHNERKKEKSRELGTGHDGSRDVLLKLAFALKGKRKESNTAKQKERYYPGRS